MTETDTEFVERLNGNREFWSMEDVDRLISLARRGAAVQWRPISEAGDEPVLAFGCLHENGGNCGERPGWHIAWRREDDWYSPDMGSWHPTHFIPLTALGEPSDTLPSPPKKEG